MMPVYKNQSDFYNMVMLYFSQFHTPGLSIHPENRKSVVFCYCQRVQKETSSVKYVNGLKH